MGSVGGVGLAWVSLQWESARSDQVHGDTRTAALLHAYRQDAVLILICYCDCGG